MTARPRWSQLAPSHRRWALVALLPALWLSGTGTLLALKPWLGYRGDAVLGANGTETLPLVTLLESIERVARRGRIESVHPPERAGHAYRAVLRGDENASRQVALFHPATGAWLGFRSADEEDFWKLLYRLHRGKVLELPGQIVVTLGALALFVVAGSGIRLALARRASGTAAPRRRRWHTKVAIGAAVLLVPVWLTGIPLNFQAPLAAWLDPLPTLERTPAMPVLPWTTLLRAVDVPPSALEGIYFPRRPGDPLQFFAKDGARRYVDPSSGQLVARRDRSRRGAAGMLAWLYPLHGGEILGTAGRAWVLLGALLLLASVGTGLGIPGAALSWRNTFGTRTRSMIKD